jgi:hypothetical protein
MGSDPEYRKLDAAKRRVGTVGSSGGAPSAANVPPSLEFAGDASREDDLDPAW